ncbi:2-C-methyl-D-erythritol 4-phosphate cytidylyltransferase [Dokdonella sp.]|uniref:2-C-methyl-D-erythritol 4-phosphate cytidylyltransferase n=1 Tax=Dokdonella sp. TaxID=2291710 RepID=UPI003C6345C2
MTDTESDYWCVVPAAGRGSRFGGDVPKQYALVAGKPLIQWTLEALALHPRIAGIVVALAATDSRWVDLELPGGKPLLRVDGGGERADSVAAGLRGLPECVTDQHFVLVHDAARPCVLASDIDKLIDHGRPAGGALLAAPMRDTLKRADAHGRIMMTEPRDGRWRAMTPQFFRRGELLSALEAALVAGDAVSDEAMAMERAGFSPLLVEGSEDNIKVTTPADLALAGYLLGREQSIGNG